MNVIAHEVPNFGEMKNPGDFVFTKNEDGQICGMIEMCPCGCRAIGGINFDIGEGKTRKGSKWQWNGSKEKPTLTPSILRPEGCKWHGYLTDGVFISC